jgi:hypothetical protein
MHTKLLVVSSQPDFQLTTDSWTGLLNCLQDNSSERTTSKTPFFYCSLCVRFRENVFTEPLLTNGLHNTVVLSLCSNGRCL